MSRNPGLLKRLVLTLLGVVALLVFTLYFVLQYRIKMVLKEVVDMETGGAYSIDFSKHSFSVFNADIKLKNVRFTRTKPAIGEASYDVTIPNFYISIDSWKSLLIDRKLVIDSLFAESPEVKVMEANQILSGNKVSLQLNDAYEALKKITHKFEVQTLSVRNAALGLYPGDSSQAFIISHLDLTVRNFSQRKKDSRNFLLTDDIDILVRNQDWVLADGDSLSFSRLHFSAKKQRFIIDSCSLRSTNIEKGRTINIRADQFFINSTNLTAAYLQNKLIIDTLTCINPVVELERNKSLNKDTASLRRYVGKVFDFLSFKYISVIDGQLLLLRKQDGKTVSYASQKSNIRLYNLDIKTGTPSSITLGDLKFDFDTVRFFTPDSHYVLRVGNFSIQNSDLVCNNASFVPRAGASRNIQLFFPQIILRNISLPDLWQKKLKADQAIFNRPEIFIKEQSERKKIKISGKSNPYEILHDFSTVVNVSAMFINEGVLQFQPASERGMAIKTEGINAVIQLNQLFRSGSLVEVRSTVARTGLRRFQLSTPEVNLILEDVIIGAGRKNAIGLATVQLPSGIDLQARGIFWHQFDWEQWYNNQKLKVDELRFNEVSFRYHPKVAKVQQSQQKVIPFEFKQIRIDQLNVQLNLLNGVVLGTKGNEFLISGLENGEKGLQWQDFQGVFKNALYRFGSTNITFDRAVFDKQNGSYLKNTKILRGHNRLLLPEVKLSTTIKNTNISNLHLQYLIINDPEIFIARDSFAGGNSDSLQIPLNVTADQLQVNNAKFRVYSKDSSVFTTNASLKTDSITLLKHIDDILSHGKVSLYLSNAKWENKKMTVDVPSINVNFPSGSLQKHQSGLRYENQLHLLWKNADIRFKDSTRHKIFVTGVSGDLDQPQFMFNTSEKLKWRDAIKKLKVTEGSVHFSDKTHSVTVNKIYSDIARGEVIIEEVNVLPQIAKHKFFEEAPWQTDYRELRAGKITLTGADIPKFLEDTAVDIQTITIQDAVFVTSRDKNMPFKHGIEKLMPTKLIETIRRPFRVHALVIKNANITSNEIAVETQREGAIPFISVNGEIRNITNRPGKDDSLYVSANAMLLDYYIRNFHYKESYSDSLSGFQLTARLSPMDLTVFSKITNPLAALDIRRGKADTLNARVVGNKYGSFGEMRFYYQKLKLRFLNPLDTTKKNFGLSFKNFVTNEFVVRSNNKKPAQFFYIRDTEKFIFNYWFKSIFSGVIASAGISTDKKYYRQYKQLKEIYALPPKE